MKNVHTAFLVFIICCFAILMPFNTYSQTGSPFLVSPLLCKPTSNSMTISLVAGDESITCYARFAEADLQKPDWLLTDRITITSGTTGELRLNPLKSDRS